VADGGAQEIAEPSFRADDAVLDDADAVAKSLGVGEDVRREEDRLPPLLERQDDVAKLAASDRIEAAHRLVEDHEVGIVDQSLRRGRSSGASLRVLPELLAGAAPQSDPVEDRLDAPPPLVRRVTEEPAAVVEELLAREVLVENTGFREENRSAPSPRRRCSSGRTVAPTRVGEDEARRVLIVVVLPAPFCPRRPKISPAETVRVSPGAPGAA